MLRVILPVLIGGGIGAAVGHLSRCAGGTCPLMCAWWRGAIYGGVLGLLFGLSASGGGGESVMNQSTANVKHVTASDFDAEVNASAQPMVVDFYATWCGPCKAQAPVLEELAGQFQGRIRFVKVNIDEAPALADRFGITGVPTLLFFKDGKIADRRVGLTPAKELERRLQSFDGTKAAVSAQ